MDKPYSSDVIMVFSFNLVNHITGQMSLGNLWQLQEQLAMNSKAIQIPCKKIGHASFIYTIDTYMQFNTILCTLPKKLVDPGLIAQYAKGGWHIRKVKRQTTIQDN